MIYLVLTGLAAVMLVLGMKAPLASALAMATLTALGIGMLLAHQRRLLATRQASSDRLPGTGSADFTSEP